MKFGVITFPGSNCDQDMISVLRDEMGQKVESIWHKETNLKGSDFIVLPGGFSYGDYLRSGAIARFSPIMEEVINHAKKGGYVLGICNGFQILLESGLLEGSLLHNNNQKFICKNIWLKPSSISAPISKSLNREKSYKIPIAHGEGRFYAPKDIVNKIQDHDGIIFKYCNESGTINEEANPNGSLLNIAGICNQKKNVFGMMPHPERAASESLANEDGKDLFNSLLNNCQ